jgi:hypothetical protein
MEPPAALALDVSAFRTASPGMDWGRSAMIMAESRPDDAGVIEIQVHEQLHLAPRVRRFFNAYLDADAVRRGDFRKAVAFASYRFGFDPPATPSLEEDIAAALAIAHDAIDIAYAIDIGEVVDEAGSGLADPSLVADAYTMLALGYLYIVGFCTTDPTMGDLGEVAVRFVLLAEREYDSALAVTVVPQPRPAMSHKAFGSNQELESSLSIFLPPAPGQRELVGTSLEVISRRLKDQILLTA